MRRLAPGLLSLLMLLALLCPALCLAQTHHADAHACCHGSGKSVAKAAPCGTATFAQFTDRYPVAPASAALPVVRFAPPVLTALRATDRSAAPVFPPSPPRLAVLRI